MAANLRKAGSAIRKSFRSSRYTVFGTKENFGYEDSPKWSSRKFSDANDDLVEVDEFEVDEDQHENQSQKDTPVKGKLKRTRSSVVTQSMREAVVNIRQKFRMSTRRQMSLKENTPTKTTKRRQTFGGVKKVKDVRMYSPFRIDTPTRTRNQIRTCMNQETPTRLRREVEALTANMQALSALTPNTLQTRATSRKSPPLTNGSLKTPRSTRRRTVTEL